ncbi:MAG: hypothetical protein ACRD44_18670, partial [Bryobacteraceae bacterium]
IEGVDTNFAAGQTLLGFGSADIRVRRVWVVSPTRILANVSVSPSVSQTAMPVTVASGLALLAQARGFRPSQVNPALRFQLPVTDAASGRSVVYRGRQAQVTVPDLPDFAGVQMSLNDQPVSIASVRDGVVTFFVPTPFALGPAVLRMLYRGETALPIVVEIEQAPASVVSVKASTGAIQASRPAAAGELLTIQVAGLADAGVRVNPARVKVLVAGVEHEAIQVAAGGNTHDVQFILGWPVPSGMQTMTVVLDGRASDPYTLPVK